LGQGKKRIVAAGEDKSELLKKVDEKKPNGVGGKERRWEARGEKLPSSRLQSGGKRKKDKGADEGGTQKRAMEGKGTDH